MFKVLVPVNGSECSLKAVDEAIRIARSNGNTMIELVNVQPCFPRHMSRFLSNGQTQAIRIERGANALEAGRRRVKAADVRCTTQILYGPIVPSVAAYARETGAGQIVVGTSPVCGRLMRASIADRLIEHSPVPVDVVRGGNVGPFERFGLPAGLGLSLAVFWYASQ